MRLFQTQNGPVVEDKGVARRLTATWDDLLGAGDLNSTLRSAQQSSQPVHDFNPHAALAPIGSQEVWAAGVTYMRSREARMEEAKSAGGGDFYDRVYSAERPELFFKSSGHRVVPSGGKVRIRRDSKWNVPEPELTLLISSAGNITGYT